MSESDSIYSIFKSIDEEAFTQLTKNIEKPFNLCIPDKIFNFCKRAFTSNVFKIPSSTIKLSSLKESSGIGTLIVPCLDDPFLLETILKKFSIVPKYKKILFMIPRMSPQCKEIYDKYQNQGIIYKELSIEIVGLSQDEFLIPLPIAFTNSFCDLDISDVYPMARALLKLQLINGKPSRVFTAGVTSQRVNTLMNELSQQISSTNFREDSYYDDLFIIDRTCDLLTPLLTQWTYGGILNDSQHPEYNFLDLPNGIKLKLGDNTYDSVTIDKDPVYSEIKFLQIKETTAYLTGLKREGLEVVQEMKASTGTPKWRSLKKRATEIMNQSPYIELHFQILEHSLSYPSLFKDIINFELDQIEQQNPNEDLIISLIHRCRYLEALKLLCITSLTNRGISKELFDRVGQLLINEFGFEFLKEWNRLETSGFITIKKSVFKSNNKPKFSELSENLKLIEKDSSLSQFYSSYIPILIRLVEYGLKNEWKPGTNVEKVLNSLSIPFNVTGKISNPRKHSDGKEYRRALIFVIGGITQSEQMMFTKIGENLFDFGYEFHIGSTSIISATRILQQTCPSL